MTEDTDIGVTHRLAVAEHATQKAQHELLRTKVIHAYGIGSEDAEALLTATDEDTLIRQAEGINRLASRDLTRGNYVPREGSNPGPPRGGNQDMRTFVRELFDGNYDPL